jgi:hypothetical protein
MLCVVCCCVCLVYREGATAEHRSVGNIIVCAPFPTFRNLTNRFTLHRNVATETLLTDDPVYDPSDCLTTSHTSEVEQFRKVLLRPHGHLHRETKTRSVDCKRPWPSCIGTMPEDMALTASSDLAHGSTQVMISIISSRFCQYCS